VVQASRPPGRAGSGRHGAQRPIRHRQRRRAVAPRRRL